MNLTVTNSRLLGALGLLLLGALLTSALADHNGVRHVSSLSALPLASGHSVPVEQRIGLGFAVSRRNGGSHVVTAAHVVDGCEVIGVTYGDQSRRQAVLMGLDENNDLALLFVQGEATDFVRFKPQGQPSGNNRIFRGSHDGFGIASAEGETIGYRGAALDTRLMSFHGQAVKPGESGGPVFDRDGHVIGMIIGHVPDMEIGSNSLRHISHALKAPILLAFLSAFDNPQTVEPLHGPRENVDLHNLVARTTADVTCIAATRTSAGSGFLSDGYRETAIDSACRTPSRAVEAGCRAQQQEAFGRISSLYAHLEDDSPAERVLTGCATNIFGVLNKLDYLTWYECARLSLKLDPA